MRSIIQMINSTYYWNMNDEANKLRRKWYIDEYVPIDIFSIIKNKIPNLTMVFMDMGDKISGASSEFEGYTTIFLNSQQTYGRQRFSLAHEVYHLLIEEHSDKEEDKQVITCMNNSNEKIEKQADEFASCLLLPHNALKYYEEFNGIEKNEDWTIEKIIDTEQYFQISHHALMWRLRNLNIISYEFYQKYKSSPVKKARKMGYNTKLYESYTGKEETTDGMYIYLLNKLYDDDLISIEEKNRYLTDAFCD